MRSLILQIAIRVLFPLLIIASLLSLFRGHHDPGGGFIGGLVAASAFVLLLFTHGVERTEQWMRAQPHTLITAGLLLALAAALFPLLFGRAFFEAMWAGFYLPVIGMPGTPMLFDIGVYLVVVGVVCKIVFSLAADE
jgi:multicomponent Na+:H+ antiporter subunit B